jgi:hypothetical protein
MSLAREVGITMTTDTEALVRRAYHFAQGDVLDIQGFTDLFTDDGGFNAGQEQSYRGEHLGVSVNSMLAQIGVLPDFASAVAAPAPAQ